MSREARVKKLISVALMVGLIAASMVMPAEAGKKKKKGKKKAAKIERVVELTYSSPGIGVTAAGRGGGYPVNFPESTEIPTLAQEKYIKIEVEDSSGQAVAGFISQGDLDGNGVNDDGYGTFCGAHPEPIELASPGAPIVGVYAYNGTCEDGTTPSVMTSGTVKITLSNMP
jgi:hypothetical protein